MKADARTEAIFSHAVALQQGGRLRNSIHLSGKEIYILNVDRTLLLRFECLTAFESEVSFEAGDYDSPHFYAEDGGVTFVQGGKELERKKRVRAAAMSFDEVKALYDKYQFKNYRNSLSLTKAILPFLDENLSHLEFAAKNNKAAITQRDIYTGTVLHIAPNSGGRLLGDTHMSGTIQSDFGPVGMRTNDFLALFSFNDRLTVKFPLKQERGYCLLESTGDLPFTGVLSYCVYDEIGELEVIDNGGKEQKKRRC